MQIRSRSLWLAPLAFVSSVLITTVPGAARSSAFEPVTRVIYITATDAKGAPVTDLTAADLAVKEGGKDRTIDKVEPATAKVQLTLLVQDRLAGLDGIHAGLGSLIEQCLPQANVAVYTVAFKNEMVTDYTSDANALVKALNSLGMNPGARDEHIVEGISDLAKMLTQKKVERSVLVVAAISGPQTATVNPDSVMDQLRQSGTVMYSATIDSGTASTALGGEDSALDRVLGEGPKQSGGRRDEVTGQSAGMANTLKQFGAEISHQYAVTYTLPDGVKMSSNFNISTKRKGVNLHAPSRIPDK